MYLSLTLCAIVVVYLPSRAKSLPPDACFQPFKWQDCGQPPKPVMYYWKTGSRCEVGFWRGCVPNLNMFKDEYECVATCVFAPRARPIDYHSYNALEFEDQDDDADDEGGDATTIDNDGDATTIGNSTAGGGGGDSSDNSTGGTTADGGGGGGGGGDSSDSTGGGGGDATTAAGGGGGDETTV